MERFMCGKPSGALYKTNTFGVTIVKTLLFLEWSTVFGGVLYNIASTGMWASGAATGMVIGKGVESTFKGEAGSEV